MDTLNLGILAHVDAGKTTLTERLLFEAGAIAHAGSVDEGTTQTDTLALDRERGITIRSAVASFSVRDLAVNIIDTPGHPDFIAEVERALRVLDGAVLVISAVEGVQAQTPLLFRALQRLGIPTLIFVNKIDRRGADTAAVLDAIRRRLTPRIFAMGEVHEPGSAQARFDPEDDRDEWQRLAEETRHGTVFPVYFGSAATGAGVAELAQGIAEMLPRADGDPAAPLAGHIFKVERGQSGRVAFVRLFAGSLRVRERVTYAGATHGRITRIEVFGADSNSRRASILAGEIGRVCGA